MCRASLSPGQPARDAEQLHLLSLSHYICAGLLALMSCFPFIHVAVGVMTIAHPEAMGGNSGKALPPMVGWLFVIMGSLFILSGWTMAAFMAYAGKCIARRRRHLLCLVVAGLSCLFMPFGTILGVLSLIVLQRPSVKALFGAA